MRMVRSCWAGVGAETAPFALASSEAILSLSWATRDLRYSSSSRGAIVGTLALGGGRDRKTWTVRSGSDLRRGHISRDDDRLFLSLSRFSAAALLGFTHLALGDADEVTHITSNSQRLRPTMAALTPTNGTVRGSLLLVAHAVFQLVCTVQNSST
jgi:hypothetical protein